MNFNQRLRQKVADKGPEAAKQWGKRLDENARTYDASENERAEEIVKEFRKKQSKHLVVSK